MFREKNVEIIEEHILCSIIFFSEDVFVYEIMWKYTVVSDRPQLTVQHGAEEM